MKNYLFSIRRIVFGFFLLFIVFFVRGQISITTLPYSPAVTNFDTYNPTNATTAASSLPSGWSLIIPASPAYNGKGTGTGNSNGFWGFDPGGTVGTEWLLCWFYK